MSFKTLIRQQDRVIGLGGLLFSITMLYFSSKIPSFSIIPGAPGPSAYPKLISIFLIILSAALIMIKPQGKSEQSEVRLSAVLKTLLICAAYVALVPVIGFYITTALFLPGFMIMQGERKLVLLIVFPIAMLVLVYLVFTLGLGVMFP